MKNEKEEKIDRTRELVEKYNIDLERLEEEQIKLAKKLELKDNIDFSLADRIAGIESIFFKNRIISAIVVLLNGEIVEQEYFEEKLKFPFIPGFRAYRELQTMINAFDKLDEKPDVVFIHGDGILHPRGLGIASHFSLATGIPSIGVSDFLIQGEVRGEDILVNNKILGKTIITKQGARPIYLSPGNLISVNSSVELVKKFIKEPHKIPEPLRLARKYGKDIRKELFNA